MAGGILNQGTDNVFTNASNGDGNNNNIERVDVLFPSGLNTTSPAQAGFAIFDRGNNFQHDPFRIAAITSMDAQGNPTSFGAVKTCVGGNGSNSNGSWGHPSQANGNKQLASYVLRKDVSDLFLRASSNVNQELGGVFYSFADLGIKAGQALYGYALLGPDGLASPTTAQLLDLGNTAVYPIQTTEAVGGGLDLVAVNTVFQTGSYVVLSTPAAPPSRLPDSAVSFTGWKIYPTMPRQGQELTLQGLHDGVYSVLFYNASGIAYTTSVRVHGETSLAVPAMPGIYWVQVRSADGRLMPGSGKLVIQ